MGFPLGTWDDQDRIAKDFLFVARRAQSEKLQRSHAEKSQARHGAIAQLGERLPCTQEVGGSIPPGSTIFYGQGQEVW